GGYPGGSSYISSAEVYDPATNTWTTPNSMATTRGLLTATLLPSGKVLVSGGYNYTEYDPDTDAAYRNFYYSTDMYDPGTNSWSAAAAMPTPRYQHTATLLLSGRLLITGGIDSSGSYLNSSVVYTP
ncbi:Kelch repeat-containing protein, partial [Archangium sp.]|uniref:Kelch repeat-containing protein n=1 Tax=Archangium sp. TaxID=1872627 RepID=UPI00389A5634